MVAKIQYLKDTFDSLTIDAGIWSYTAGVTNPGGGILEFTLSNTYRTLISVSDYDLGQSEVSAYLEAFGPGMTRELLMSCYIDADNDISFLLSNETLILRIKVAGVSNDASIPFDRNLMKRWKIKEQAGIAYWYTSADGVLWELQRQVVHGLTVSSLKLRISTGYYGDVGTGLYGGDTYGGFSSGGGYGSGPYGSGPYGEDGGSEGLYGGVSGLPPDVVWLYGINEEIASTIPSGPPAVIRPLPAPSWVWAVGPHSGDAPEYELTRATGARRLNLKLKEPSQASFTVIGHSEDAQQIINRVSDLWCYRNGVCLFRGRVDTISISGADTGEQSISVQAVDYRGVLNRALVDEDFTTTSEDQATTAWNLVVASQNLPGGSNLTSLTQDPAWVTTGVLRSGEFKAGDSVWEAIKKYGDLDNGFDVEIDEDLVFYLHWPKMGEANGEILDYGGLVNNYSINDNADKFANVVRMSGGEGTVSSVQVTDDIAITPEGRWAAQYSDNNLHTDAEVTAAAKAKLLETSAPLPVYSLDLARGLWRGRGHLWLGDEVRVVIKHGAVDDNYVTRIFEMVIDVDINNHETISVVAGATSVNLVTILMKQAKMLRSLTRR